MPTYDPFNNNPTQSALDLLRQRVLGMIPSVQADPPPAAVPVEANDAYQHALGRNLESLYPYKPGETSGVTNNSNPSRMRGGEMAVPATGPTMRGYGMMDRIGDMNAGVSRFLHGLMVDPETGQPNLDLGMTSLSRPAVELIKGTPRAQKALRISQRIEGHLDSLKDKARILADTEPWPSPIFDQLDQRYKRWDDIQKSINKVSREKDYILGDNKSHTFESSLRNVLAQPNMPESYTGPMLQQLLNKLPGQGIKKEELKWLGMPEFVEQAAKGKKRVSRDELLKWVDDNTVDVVEHTGGRGVDVSDFTPQYEQHTVPGGDNYREVLLQWGNKPVEKIAPDPKDLMRLEDLRVENFGPDWGVVHAPDGTPIREEFTTQEEAANWLRANGQRAVDDNNAFYSKERTADSNFTSSHFDQPNILAHMRLKDRTTPDGKKVLFIEEIQSDWHQAARDIPKKQDWNKRVQEVWGVKNRMPDAGSVPDAPFRENWHDLASKRIMRMAQEQGYDAVAWTPGKVHQDRYNQLIRDGVDKVVYDPQLGNLEIYKNGRVIEKTFKLPEELPTVLGWDVSEKLLSAPRAKRNVHFEPRDLGSHTAWDVYDADTDELLQSYLSDKAKQKLEAKGIDLPAVVEGDDLKVGKAGMETFYDKMLPSTFEKHGKKMGTRVRRENIGDSPAGMGFDDEDMMPYGIEAAPLDAWIMDLPKSAKGTKPKFPLYEVALPALGLGEMARQQLFESKKRRD